MLRDLRKLTCVSVTANEGTPSSHFFSSVDIMKRIWLGRALFGIIFFKLSFVLQNQIDPEFDEDFIQIIIFYRNLQGSQTDEMFSKTFVNLGTGFTIRE